MLVLQVREWMQIWGKVLLCTPPGLMISPAEGLKRMVTKVQWQCWRSMSMSCTIERGNPLSTVTSVASQITEMLGAVHQIHDNWVASYRIWSRRSFHRFYGRAQTYGNRSNVWNSRKLLYVTLTFETKVHRSEWFAQVNLISVTPMLQNLRIGLRKRKSRARARCPWSSVEAGQKCCKIKGAKQSSILLTFGK